MHTTAEVSEWTNRNIPARNTLVQLLAPFTELESRNARRYRQTDGQTDNIMMPIADHSYCVAVRSAKNANWTV